jgi:hypothetical protein
MQTEPWQIAVVPFTLAVPGAVANGTKGQNDISRFEKDARMIGSIRRLTQA